MSFLDSLDKLLKSNNMTRSDLGRALDIPISTINSWYNRSSDGVALKTLVAIAKYFDVSLDYLVNGEENFKEPPTPKEVAQLSAHEVIQIKRILKYYELLNSDHKGGGEDD